MMRTHVSTILVSLLLVFSLACSSTPKKRSVGEVIDDSVISNKLKARYLKNKQVEGFQINVDTWKGVVSLRGRVENSGQIRKAIEIAERQAGVKEVKSYLVIRPQNSKKNDEILAEQNLEKKESTTASQQNDTVLEDEEYLDDEPLVTSD